MHAINNPRKGGKKGQMETRTKRAGSMFIRQKQCHSVFLFTSFRRPQRFIGLNLAKSCQIGVKKIKNAFRRPQSGCHSSRIFPTRGKFQNQRAFLEFLELGFWNLELISLTRLPCQSFRVSADHSSLSFIPTRSSLFGGDIGHWPLDFGLCFSHSAQFHASNASGQGCILGGT